ncbi:MAG: hypothetical protein ABI414_00680 [Devosia sp.]
MRVTLGYIALCLPLLATAAHADCADEIRAVMTRALTSGPYIAHTTIKTGNSSEDIVVEAVPPGAVHSWYSTGETVNEMIMIDGRAWGKELGTWVERPAAGDLANHTVEDGLRFLDRMTDPVCKGDTVANGVTFTGYAYLYTAENFASAVTILVDRETGLPKYILSRDHIGDTTTRNVTTYSFGVALEIVAPN